MTPAIHLAVALERATQTDIMATKHGGHIPRKLRRIEYNIQKAYTRYQTNTGVIYWAYLPHKLSTLSARVYAHTEDNTIQVAVYEQEPQDPTNTTKGVNIDNWTVSFSMDGEWERDLADLAGRAMKQAEKQPRCLCGAILRIQSRREDPVQILECCKAPRCSHIATIKEYGYAFDQSRIDAN